MCGRVLLRVFVRKNFLRLNRWRTFISPSVASTIQRNWFDRSEHQEKTLFKSCKWHFQLFDEIDLTGLSFSTKLIWPVGVSINIFSKVANGVFNFSTKTCFWRYLVRRELAYGFYVSWTTVLLRFCSKFQNLRDLAEKWFVGIEFGRKAEILKWS